MADQLTHDQFEGKEGASFTAKTEDASVELTLVEAVPHDREQTEGFSLLFEGPEDQPLPQGVFQILHDEIGEKSVFLTPVQADPHATEVVHYEVVVDRLKEKDDQ